MTESGDFWSPAAVAAMIDHTLLRPEATAQQARALCAEGVRLGVYSVCVSPSLVPVAVRAARGPVKVATVCGFPSGAHASGVKAVEAAGAVAAGADEVDMVVNLGFVKGGDFDAVRADIAEVVVASKPAMVKVIIESACLTDEEIVACCRAAVDAGAGLVKTSTGFHPSGGASVRAVRLMRATVGPDVGVKASGGIRSAADALAMLEAGASRLGCSATAAILAEVAGGGVRGSTGSGG